MSLILGSTLVGSAARAQDLQARERTARTSCLSGDYAKGVALLSELFVDTRNPTYIYNQGRCFEQSRRYEDAMGRFQEYLRVGRNLSPEEVAEAKKHIADCKQLLSEDHKVVAPPVPPPAAVEPPDPVVAAVVAQPSGTTAAPGEAPAKPGRGLRTAGIVVGGTGVAGIVAGILLSLKANELANDMERLDGYTPAKESSRKDYRNLGLAAYGVGGACIATGAVLYFLGFRAGATESPRVAIAPLISPALAGAALTGPF